MKQTAVEWLVNELERDDSKIARVIGLKKYNFIIRLAKEMEKQQIIDALKAGVNMEIKGIENYSNNFQQYCKKTFNR
jgi:hypothetical protein